MGMDSGFSIEVEDARNNVLRARKLYPDIETYLRKINLEINRASVEERLFSLTTILYIPIEEHDKSGYYLIKHKIENYYLEKGYKIKIRKQFNWGFLFNWCRKMKIKISWE